MSSHFALKGGQFDLRCQSLLEPQAGVGSAESIDLGQSLREAFSDPQEFPPIEQAIVPGDRVAIAVDSNAEAVQDIVEHLIAFLSDHGVNPDSIDLVSSGPVWNSSRSWHVHHSDDEQQLAFLTALDDRPVYVNRELFDSDVVIPIITTQGSEDADPICPGMCGDSTAELLDRLPSAEKKRLIDHLNDCLGVFWGIQWVPGTDGQASRVFVGRRDSIESSARAAYRDIWKLELPQKAELVIATLEGHGEQTWSNARRAIINADQAASESGCIVLCSQLNQVPGDKWIDWQEPRTEASSDTLSSIFQNRHVYLISELPEETTEEIGFGFIENDQQLNRLTEQFASCILLRDAHKIEFVSPE